MEIKKFILNKSKLILSITFLLVLSLSFYFYVSYKYTDTMNLFYEKFNNCEFEEAKNILSKNNGTLVLNQKSTSKDLTNYFTSVIDKLCSDTEIDENSSTIITVLEEINTYDIMDNSLNELIFSIDDSYIPNSLESYNGLLSLGIDLYEKDNFTEAIIKLENIPVIAEQIYDEAQNYIMLSQEGLKKDLFKEADALAANKFYTKAIDFLSNADKSLLPKDDVDINEKIESLTMIRDEYIEFQHLDDVQYTSNAILECIDKNNINTLNIESKTPYLIYVNLSEQKTDIYEGELNNWNLINSFECSTGLPGKETPNGVFSITGRGDWFFSKQFGQGGKYWVQFLGDYLFHSVPFDENQSKILDYTLGEPASHGCIRLDVDAAKWIYENAPNDTKVIIN